MSIIINISNINEINELLLNNNFFIFYYLKSCNYSNQLKNKWDYITKNIKSNSIFAEIEFNDIQLLSNNYKIMAFPSIIYYENGIANDEFKTKRTYKKLNNFLNKNN
jgi:thioredoxin-like negative regulator of GroEL